MEDKVSKPMSSVPLGIVSQNDIHGSPPSLASVRPPSMYHFSLNRYISTYINSCKEPFQELSLQDKLLTPFVLLSMILGVIIGEFAPSVREKLDTAKFQSVSLRKSRSLFSPLPVV
jgi:hypothetical protein